MLCYLGYIPQQEFQDFYADLVRDISQRFQLKKLVEKKRVPHITLKSPFEMGSLHSLEELITDFCQKQKQSQITIRGVGNFIEEVIFLYSQPSKQMTETFGQLLSRLRSWRDITWNEYDTPKKALHVTLAKGEELNGKFRDVYKYLLKRDIHFNLLFDNITIFQKNGKRTSVYRTHYFKKE